MDKKNAKNDRADTALKVFKYGIIVLVALVVIAVGFGIWYSWSTSFVATVKGKGESQTISKAEFLFFLKNAQTEMLIKAGNPDPATFWSSKIDGEDAREVAKKEALKSAQEMKVQVIEAKKAGMKLSKEDTDIVKNAQDSLYGQAESKDEANKQFKLANGITIDELGPIYNEYLLANKYKTEQIDKISLTEGEKEEFYNKNPKNFISSQFRENGEEAAWARHILIKTVDDENKELPADKAEAAKKKAEEVLAKVKSGEDFVKLSAENSEDPGSASRGGDYVFGKGKMDPAFESAAFELAPGGVTDLVKTTFGYHIIKLEGKFAQDEPVSFKCAKEYYEYGDAAFKNGKYQEMIETLKGEYNVTTNANFDKITVE